MRPCARAEHVAFADDDDEKRAHPADAQQTLARLYRDEAPRLRRRLRARLAADEACDVVQDAFARLLGSGGLGSLRRPEAFLNRIVANLLIDRARRAATRGEQLRIDEDIELSVAADQVEQIELAQMQERYRAAVARLPDRMQQVFILHRVDELGYKEIAVQLGISTRTVEWNMAQAILRMTRMLEDE